MGQSNRFLGISQRRFTCTFVPNGKSALLSHTSKDLETVSNIGCQGGALVLIEPVFDYCLLSLCKLYIVNISIRKHGGRILTRHRKYSTANAIQRTRAIIIWSTFLMLCLNERIFKSFDTSE